MNDFALLTNVKRIDGQRIVFGPFKDGDGWRYWVEGEDESVLVNGMGVSFMGSDHPSTFVKTEVK